ncbi:hypothetical protein TYRP_010055 [Tyrophagus putrescentiae]|nr:hypothetical protein TYRP_010055 [Tyrophagus putrescentiae]
MPSSVQFLGNSSMNYLDASISPCRPLRSISAFGGITSSTASVSKLNGNSALRIAEPLVEEPASDGEDGESQSNKHNSELTDSEPEEEDGILIERAIPIAKGCDSTNISSRVFLDQQYLNSLFNRKVTLHMSEISELFSYENEADVVDGNSKSAKTSNKTIKNENISNGKCSGKTTKLNGQLISTSHETHKNARSTLKSSKTASSSLTECNVVYDKPSASKLPPLNIKTSTDLSSPASPQSPTSPLSTSSLVSPLSPPSASAYSRKKVALTGAKKCVLESYSIETDKTTSKMSVKTAEAQQTKHFHPSSFLNRLTSEMIDSGALLSEDEEDKQKELKKIKLKNPLKKEKPPVIGANKANAKVKSSAMKRSFEEFKEEGNTLICSPKSASSECRRSARNRVCPLNYWTGQRPLYHVTMDNRGNPLKTLVGVQPGNAEPKKRKTLERKKHLKNDKNQKMVNIFNLSIDHPRFAKKFTNTESHDHEHVLAYNQVEFRESSKSPGVFTALTKKASNIAFGKLKFTPKSQSHVTSGLVAATPPRQSSTSSSGPHAAINVLFISNGPHS